MEYILGEISNPSAAVGLRAGQIVIGSHEDTSKKTKDTVLISWCSATGITSEDIGTKEWDLSLKSEVLLKDTMKRHRLDKLLKEVCPQVGEIWKYTAFPPGTLPKVLVKKQPQHVYNFVSKSAQKDTIHKFIHLGRTATSCSLLWIVKAGGKSNEVLEPRGLAFVTNKQVLLPGKGEWIVE